MNHCVNNFELLYYYYEYLELGAFIQGGLGEVPQALLHWVVILHGASAAGKSGKCNRNSIPKAGPASPKRTATQQSGGARETGATCPEQGATTNRGGRSCTSDETPTSPHDA